MYPLYVDRMDLDQGGGRFLKGTNDIVKIQNINFDTGYRVLFKVFI